MYSRDVITTASLRLGVVFFWILWNIRSENRGSEEVTYQVCLSFHNMEQSQPTTSVMGPNVIVSHQETVRTNLLCPVQATWHLAHKPRLKHWLYSTLSASKLPIIPTSDVLQLHCSIHSHVVQYWGLNFTPDLEGCSYTNMILSVDQQKQLHSWSGRCFSSPVL